MNKTIQNKIRALLLLFALLLTGIHANAISLWVGQSYTWDFSSAVMGSTYNFNVSVNGGYLSVTGTGFYRQITPTQYFSGTATVTAEWDYTLYYGGTLQHRKVSISIECRDNQVSISPTSISLAPGESRQLFYSHQFDNEYVSAANAYFSGGNSCFSVTRNGLITAKSPGSGTVNVYSKVSSVSPYCSVTVRNVEPTSASTGNYSVLADQSIDLSVDVSPYNATVNSRTWYVKRGTDVVGISGSRLTGLKPGSAVVYCMVNGSVRSNDATVTVTEPKLTETSCSPSAGATDVSVFVIPSVTYSHEISKGSEFGNVSLNNGSGKVDGTVEISGRVLRFLPLKPLKAFTTYTLRVPRNAIKNKWESSAQSDVSLSFTTADYDQASVTFSPVSGTYLTSVDRITLSATPSDAIIYYTLDGKEPTTASAVYFTPLKVEGDATVKAFAMREGYKNSEVVTAEYYKSQSEITRYYPNDASPLFNYASACPHIKFSGMMERSNNFRRISLTTSSGENVVGEALLTYNIVTFVPDEPLKNSTTYTMDIPRDAIKTTNGEIFRGFNWTFTTPTLPMMVGMQGDESVFVLSENGLLQARGMNLETYNSSDGSFTFKDYQTLTEKLTGVESIACGYTHHLFKKGSDVSGKGMAFCGETGTSASISSIGNAKSIKAGFQTSAIISDDNTLWMCGRNDFYQINGTGNTTASFVKVAENVLDVAPGNGYTLYIDTDHVLWAVGRNHKGQLGDGTTTDRKTPVKIMENVTTVYASTSGYFSACVTTGNKLYTWGDNTSGQLGREAGKYSATPSAVMDGVDSVSLGESHVLALTKGYKLYAWGANTDGQIDNTGKNITKPTLMAESVKAISAGPHTSLVLANSGKVTGFGKRAHSNFGKGEGHANNYVVYEGSQCLSLQGVTVEPWRFEAEPDSRFALIAMPAPLTADYENVEWFSANPEIARVEGNGIIHTGKLGETTITARFTDRFGTVREASSKVVCTENPVNTGIRSEAGDTSWYVNYEANRMTIRNANVGATYTVYNLQGIVIGKCKALTNMLSFEVNSSGIYLIQSGNKVVKITCQ